MNNNLIQPMPISRYKKSEDAEFEILCKMPKEFQKNDPKLVETFCKRMREIREIRNAEAIDSADFNEKLKGNHKLRGQKELAEVLGVTSMAISKYESYDENPLPDKNGNITKTKIKSIPLQHLRRICCFYDATPHYLLGYVNEPDDLLSIDDNGNIEHDQNGNPRILRRPMAFKSAYEVSCEEEYHNLAITDVELYVLINKMLLANDNQKQICKQFLAAMFDKS